MPSSEPGIVTFSPRKLRPFVELGERMGVDVAGLLARHGMSERAMTDPDSRMPRAQCLLAVRELLEELKDPLAGLRAAEHFTLEDLDLIGYMARQHPDALAALEAVVGYACLVGDSSRASVATLDGEVTLSQWIAGDAPLQPELADYLIASSYRGLCELAGSELTPLRVMLARPKPADASAYRRFFGAPVTFGALRGALIYPEAALRGVKQGGDPRLAQLLTRQAEERVSRLMPDATLTERACSELRRQLELGPPSLSALARSLCTNERTLRRHLDAAGTTYRKLLDTVRREHALSVAQAGAMKVTELALRLGFRDVTAFARAFRRWTGVNPSHYQRREPNRSAPHVASAAEYKPPSRAG